MRSLRPYLQGGSAARSLETLAEPKVFDSLVRLLCCLPRHSLEFVRSGSEKEQKRQVSHAKKAQTFRGRV